MGGVGKTQLAIEYAYRYMHEYQIIWYIPADQEQLVPSSLAALAPRLGLENITPGRVEDAAGAVLDALRRGEPYSRWLVIFDNADQPEQLKGLLPSGPGHVIITSRNHRWQSMADIVEVDVFTRQESLDFMTRRVPGVKQEEANRLAEELGDLPLALEQAGALQVESGMTVDEYLDLLAIRSRQLLKENPPADYPVGVAAAWSLAEQRVKNESPFAWELLRRCAFFSPDPIQRDLFKTGRFVLGPPLQDGLGDPILLARATRELGRYALVKVDNNRRTLQVHRLIQKLIRDAIPQGETEKIRHEVHLLLAAADPDGPGDYNNWQRYDELLTHVTPSEALECPDPPVRRFISNIGRYLFNIGDLRACDYVTRTALTHWTADSGSDDPDVLILSRHRANMLWARGDYDEAFALRSTTLEEMRRTLGNDHEETLLTTNGHGADLRARGDFAEALQLDEDTLSRCAQVFGTDHPDTFNVANNVAIDHGLNSDYRAALATDQRTHQDRLDFYGRDDHLWVIHSLGSVGRDLRLGGRYVEALAIAEQAYMAYQQLIRQRVIVADHQWVLLQSKDLSVARRKMGLLDTALELAEDVYERTVAAFGAKHPDALAAAMNLGNARRVYGDSAGNSELMAEADHQVEETFGHYGEVFGDDHPYTRGCALNLAIVRRRIGDPAGAKSLLEDALTGLKDRLGDLHHYTLTCMTALATSLADIGDRAGAKELGQQALVGLQKAVGREHPHTLACATNLAIDLRELGETEASQALAAEASSGYRAILPPEHFDVLDAERGERIALDFEPPPL
jgi:tetratricopeptide (TPR) repeat protein